jgi:hypothetical protein
MIITSYPPFQATAGKADPVGDATTAPGSGEQEG